MYVSFKLGYKGIGGGGMGDRVGKVKGDMGVGL